MRRIATRLRKAREAAGIPSKELADRMRRFGCPTWRQQTVSLTETAQRGLSVLEAVLLCRILDLEIADLVAGFEPEVDPEISPPTDDARKAPKGAGAIVKGLRRKSKLSQEAVAQALTTALGRNVSAMTVCRIEFDERYLRYDEARALAELYGVDFDLIVGFDAEPTITFDESRGLNAVRFHNEVVEAISGEKFTPVCCTGECCGPGSHCCVNAGPHEHTEEGK